MDRKVARLQDLESRQADPAFWADSGRAREQVQEIKTLKGWITPYLDLVTRLDDAAGLVELLEAEPDQGLQAELESEVTRAGRELETLELQTMLQGPDDTPYGRLAVVADPTGVTFRLSDGAGS